MKKWIWQQENYPNFTYEFKKLESLIQKVSIQQGYLIALAQTIDNKTIIQRQSQALENEAISTSAIEGKILNRDSVKASIAKKFGFRDIDYSKIDNSIEYLIEVLIDANTNYDAKLTQERLFAWHGAIFPKAYDKFNAINVATFRGEETMQVVGGYAGNEIVYYEAPPKSILEKEMQTFLNWFNSTNDDLIKACIAHLWFVIIHPFDDGNGRITRALTDRVLSKLEKSSFSKIYTMSKSIYEDRKGYYNALDKTTGRFQKDEPLDITYWMEWFFKTLHDALLDAQKQLSYIVDKTKFWDAHRGDELNARQIKVLNKLLDIGNENFKGDLTKKKYVKIANTAETNASRDLADLLEKACIKKVEGTTGKGTKYTINHKT